MSQLLVRTAAAVVGLVLATAGTARAADEIGLSNDGVTWSSSLPSPLFDPDFRWVPGDSETATFFVRNQGPTSAQLTIEARSHDTDQLLTDADIALAARVDGGDWVQLRNGEASAELTAQSIERGGVVRIDVNATFDPDSTNRSQSKRLPLVFLVTLADALDGGGGSGGGGDGLLPGTGSSVSMWQIAAACALIGLGVVVVRSRRDGGRDHG